MGAVPDLRIEGYEVVQEIGRGGFGVVYRAHQAGLERSVAIKVLTADLADDALQRFEREGRVLGRLSDHPHIVTVHGSGRTEDGQAFIVMEYVPRGSLAEQLRADGPLPWSDAVAMAVKVAGALETAHRAGILHRDVKPENVLLSVYGEPALADFGIARVAGGTRTATGTVTASLSHAAPEILGGDRPTEASDVYSLGSTLFTLLWGVPAFPDDDGGLAGLIGRIVTLPVPDLRTSGVPDEVCRAVEAAMAKGPGARPASALELAGLLNDAERALGRPVTTAVVREDPAVDPLAREASREPAAEPVGPGVSGATRVHARSGDPSRPRAADMAVPVVPAGHDGDADGSPVAPAPSRPRPGRRTLVAVVGVVVLGLAVAGWVRLSPDERPSEPAESVDAGPSETVEAAVGDGDARVLFRTSPDGQAPVAVVTDGQHVFVATPDSLVALHPESGVTSWSRSIALPDDPAGVPIVLAGDSVLVADDEGGISSITAATGEQRWRVEPRVAGPPLPFATSDGATYTGGPGGLAALDPITGAVRWTLDAPGTDLTQGRRAASTGIPPVLELVDGRLAILFGGGLVGVDPASGTRAWAHQLDGDLHTLATGNERLFVTTGSAAAGEFTVEAVDPASGDPIWSRVYQTAYPEAVSVAVEDVVVLVHDGEKLHGLDADSGEPDWTVAFDDPDTRFLAGGGIVVGVGDPDDGHRLLTVDVYDGTSSCEASVPAAEVPLTADHRVYVLGDDDVLHAVDPIACRQDWRYELPGEASFVTPLVIAADLGHGFAADDGGGVTGFRLWDE